jgi:hypothetical protein
MSDKQEPKPRILNEAERLARVFASQGRAPRLAAHLPDKYKKRLAALSNPQGVVSEKTPAEFAKVLREIINDQKASVKGLEDKE